MTDRWQPTKSGIVARCLGALLVTAAITGCEEPDETPLLLSALEVNRQHADAAAAPPPSAPSVDINPRLLRRFQPLRGQIEATENPITVAKTDRGRMLY